MALSQSHRTMTHQLDKIKLGIWCDYGVTLEPTEGIGVFVANLVEGLLGQPSMEKILLVSKEGQEQLLEPLRLLAPDRIEVIGNSKPPFYLRKPWKTLRQADRRRIERTGTSIRDQGPLGWTYRWFERRVNHSKASWLEGVDLSLRRAGSGIQ